MLAVAAGAWANEGAGAGAGAGPSAGFMFTSMSCAGRGVMYGNGVGSREREESKRESARETKQDFSRRAGWMFRRAQQ